MTWRAKIEEILAERREQMGERPPPEDILAFRTGDLSDTARQILLERAAVDPEVARELFDIVLFPDLPASSDEEEPSEGPGPDLRWQAFRERIWKGGERADGSALKHREDPRPLASIWDLRSWLPLAASFAIGVVLTLAMMKIAPPADVTGGAAVQSRPPVQVNLPIVELLPTRETSTRGTQRVRVSAEADGVVVTLAASGISMGDRLTYRLELRDRAGRLIDSHEGLKPGPGGVFVVTLPRALLIDGPIEMLLTDDDHAVVDSYRLELLLE